MIRIRIPATTANLGPGFDCMGLALDLWNTFELDLRGASVGGGPVIEVHGEGSDSLPADGSNLIAAVMKESLGSICPRDFKITAHNCVPCASGLGSSSTAILAGLIFAEAIRLADRGGDPAAVDLNQIIEKSTALEGHGDNVAPAVLGGFVIVVPDETGVLTTKIPHVPVRAVACVPDFAYLTTDARAALPESYAKADAIYNIGRAMLVTEALRSGDDELLARAMNDRIHEPYRTKAIPGAAEAKAAALEAGALCVSLSGAGPGLIAFTRGKFDRIGRAMKDTFSRAGLQSRYWILDASEEGLKITRLPV